MLGDGVEDDDSSVDSWQTEDSDNAEFMVDVYKTMKAAMETRLPWLASAASRGGGSRHRGSRKLGKQPPRP